MRLVVIKIFNRIAALQKCPGVSDTKVLVFGHIMARENWVAGTREWGK